jgi:hypothetical protein
MAVSSLRLSKSLRCRNFRRAAPEHPPRAAGHLALDFIAFEWPYSTRPSSAVVFSKTEPKFALRFMNATFDIRTAGYRWAERILWAYGESDWTPASSCPQRGYEVLLSGESVTLTVEAAHPWLNARPCHPAGSSAPTLAPAESHKAARGLCNVRQRREGRPLRPRSSWQESWRRLAAQCLGMCTPLPRQELRVMFCLWLPVLLFVYCMIYCGCSDF